MTTNTAMMNQWYVIEPIFPFFVLPKGFFGQIPGESNKEIGVAGKKSLHAIQAVCTRRNVRDFVRIWARLLVGGQDNRSAGYRPRGVCEKRSQS